jgi:hypothetical protein
MKVKKNEIMFLVAFLGVLAALASYVWVYLPTIEKTDALEADNATKRTELAQLQEWEKQVEFFQEETTQMILEVNGIFTNFPAEYRNQDAIMYAVDLEARDTNTYISNIGLTEPQMVYEAAPTMVKLNETMEDGERIYRLYNKQVTYTQEFTYDGMKRYINAFVNDANRKSVESINMAYDATTGILVGNTTVNFFTLTGTDKVYKEIANPSMPMGTDNIFGTMLDAVE